MRYRWIVSRASTALVLLAAALRGRAQPAPYDLLLTNARIVDGRRKPVVSR